MKIGPRLRLVGRFVQVPNDQQVVYVAIHFLGDQDKRRSDVLLDTSKA